MRLLEQITVVIFKAIKQGDYELYSTMKGVQIYVITCPVWANRLKQRRVDAYIWGDNLFIRDESLITDELLLHEFTHIYQSRTNWLFAVKYWFYHFWYGYRDNPYEEEARNNEKLDIDLLLD